MVYKISDFAALASKYANGFEDTLAFILDHEGYVYENVPGDSGGPTACGITWIDGNEWRAQHGLPKLTLTQASNIKLDYLTPDVISSIYYNKYFTFFGLDIPKTTLLVLTDGAVNMGIGQVVKELQAQLGVTVDGGYGPNTKAALTLAIKNHGQIDLCFGLINRRRAFYNQIAVGHNAQFLKGWLNRCDDLAQKVHNELGV